MELLLTPEAWLAAGLIFVLRVLNITIDTLRILVVMRGRKLIVWFLGFFQALIFVLVLGSVLKDLDNFLNIFAYAAGFATGNVVGMYIEERLAIGHVHLSIVSPRWGSAIAEKLRGDGYAVTEVPARGKDGMVTMLICSVLRRKVGQVHKVRSAY